MTARGVERLLALVLALSLLSIVPQVAADLSLDRYAVAGWWAALVVLVYLVLLAVLLAQALRPSGRTVATWGLVVVGDLVLVTYPLVLTAAPDRAPWVLALSPITVGAAAVVLKLRGAMVLGLVHLALRGWLAVTDAYVVPPLRFTLDALLLLVVVPTVSVVVQAVLGSADQVARARRHAERAASDAASARARERENARWDAIVHDDVLASLSLAAHAREAGDAVVAREAARTAVDRLSRDVAPEPVAVTDVVDRLRSAVLHTDPAVVLLVARDEPRACGQVDPDAADALVDAAAEAVRNAVRHGRPDSGTTHEVRVRIRGRGSRLLVEVRDDGVGFDAEQRPHRLGLVVSVRRRTDAVGGTALIRSRPGVGTVVLLGIPTQPPAGGAA